MTDEEMKQRVQAAYEALRPRDRDVFNAIRFYGMSYEDVAKELGCSRRKIQRIMARAIADLDRGIHG